MAGRRRTWRKAERTTGKKRRNKRKRMRKNVNTALRRKTRREPTETNPNIRSGREETKGKRRK
jgi:hypothetical protein